MNKTIIQNIETGIEKHCDILRKNENITVKGAIKTSWYANMTVFCVNN